MLVELRDRVTTEEVNLKEVLEGEGKHVRKRFPDADRLLGEVSILIDFLKTLIFGP